MLELPPIGTNCHIIWRDGNSDAIVVDPGGAPEQVLDALDRRGLTCTAILVTHTHFDHIGAVAPVAQATGAPVYVSSIEAPVLADPAPYVPAPLRELIEPWSAEHLVEPDEEVSFLGSSWRCVHLPGHSPGTIAFAACEPVQLETPVSLDGAPLTGAANLLLVGDVLFKDSIGRSDLPHADPATLAASLARLLDWFDDDTLVLSGHGQQTTVGRERRLNPFLRQLAQT